MVFGIVFACSNRQLIRSLAFRYEDSEGGEEDGDDAEEGSEEEDGEGEEEEEVEEEGMQSLQHTISQTDFLPAIKTQPISSLRFGFPTDNI